MDWRIKQLMHSDAPVTTQSILELLQASQLWPRDQMLAFQRSQLEQLLRHAKAHVPFYESRLNCVFKKDDSINWDRWAEIPVVTREDLRDRGKSMLATFVPPNHGRLGKASTSGSSGVPITVTSPQLMNTVIAGVWKRFFMDHEISASAKWSDFKYMEPEHDGSVMEVKHVGRPPVGQSLIFVNRRLPAPRKLDILIENAIDIMVDTTNSAIILAHENMIRRTPFRPAIVVCVGMELGDEQRSLIEASFMAKAISPYSSKEGGPIATQCGQSRNFHINPELNFVELAPASSTSSGTNGTGRLLITPLYNSAQPLIRYDQGDIVELGDRCRCGTNLPILTKISGRADPIFHFPGRSHTPVLNFARFHEILPVRMVQIAQVGPAAIEVRYMADAAATAQQVNLLTALMTDVFGNDVSSSFRHIEQIPGNAGGKQQRYVQEFFTG